MAKKRRSNNSKNYQTRVVRNNTKPRRLRSGFNRKIDLVKSTSVEDRRRYSPLPVAAPKTKKGTAAVVISSTVPVKTKGKRTTHRLQESFIVPEKVLTCARRKRRTEVLHALKKTGKGGQRKPRRNSTSHISCKG